MQVVVESISEEGFSRHEKVDASLWDLSNPDVKFIKNIELECKFRKVNHEILVKVSAITVRQVRCSRCLTETRQEVNQDFYLSYNKKQLGQFLEIDDDIREEILLSWPMRPLCSQECKGICLGCGKNLNLEECMCVTKD